MTGKDIFYSLNHIDSALLTKQPKKQVQKRNTWQLLICLAIAISILNICICCVAKFDKVD